MMGDGKQMVQVSLWGTGGPTRSSITAVTPRHCSRNPQGVGFQPSPRDPPSNLGEELFHCVEPSEAHHYIQVRASSPHKA